MNEQAKDATTITLRVYYADTDAGGVAHHASYLRWFEQARTEWLRQRGHGLEHWQSRGIILVVARMNLAYLRPLRLDDEITVSAVQEDKHPTGSTFVQEICLGETTACTACTASVRLVCVNLATGRPVKVPKELLV